MKLPVRFVHHRMASGYWVRVLYIRVPGYQFQVGVSRLADIGGMRDAIRREREAAVGNESWRGNESIR